MSEEIFYADETFVASIEHVNKEVIIVHCKVLVWKLSVLKLLYKELGRFLREAEEAGYKTVYGFCPKTRFCELMGFNYVGSGVMVDGVRHPQYEYKLGGDLCHQV